MFFQVLWPQKGTLKEPSGCHRKDGMETSQVQKPKKSQGAKAAPGLSQVSGVFSGHFCLVGKSKKQKILWWVVAKDGVMFRFHASFRGSKPPLFSWSRSERSEKKYFWLMRILRFDLQTIQPHDSCIFVDLTKIKEKNDPLWGVGKQMFPLQECDLLYFHNFNKTLSNNTRTKWFHIGPTHESLTIWLSSLLLQ